MGRERTLRTAVALVVGVAAVIAVAGLAGCGASKETAGRAFGDPQSGHHYAAPPGVTVPPAATGFDYQLGGAYPPPAGVGLVERDSTAQPAAGVYSICYINGFQTQPGVVWPDELILHNPDGTPFVDPGWPDEHLIDLSSPATRTAAADRQQATIDECARKGFRAVEFDNLDSFSRSKGAFTVDDAVAFATMLTERAHSAKLAVAQKNTADLSVRGRDEIGFDFAVTEECDRFSECDAFTDVYGPHVFDIEYTDDLRGTFADVCARPDTPPITILRDRELVAPGDAAHHYQRC